MNNHENSFISQLLQIAGFISAITVAVAQYIFRSNFSFLFKGNMELYTVTSLAAMILSLAGVIALFSNRYAINKKFYINSKKKLEYFRSIRDQSMNNGSGEKMINGISEPSNISIKMLSALFLLVSLISFVLMVISNHPFFISLLYIVFICLTVSSITTFAIDIYLEKEHEIKEKNIHDKVIDKIREYFTEKIKIKNEFVNENIMYQTRNMIISYNGDEYKVSVDNTNPDRFFSIERIKQGNSLG